MDHADKHQEKRIFISYSDADRDTAGELARSLHAKGENVWWDQWEILAGDSLVQKIFEEGLSNASAFVILLSKHSVQSKWVREELDLATINRIAGLTRTIPVLIDDVDVPVALRAFKRVDFRQDPDKAVAAIVNAVHGISDKPTAAAHESISKRIAPPLAGLSPAASMVARYVLKCNDPNSGQEVAVTGVTLQKELGLEAKEINDAVDELEENGFIRVVRLLGTSPYSFAQIEPTYVLYKELVAELDYEPDEDIRVVAAAVASNDSISGADLVAQTKLTPGRINHAVHYLKDFGLVEVHRALGTFPFDFDEVEANRKTRQFVNH